MQRLSGSFCFAGALRDGVVYSAQQIKLWRMTMQKIRTATFEDLDAIAAVEAACFPAAEAATKEEFAGRLTHYADHFWLLFEDEKLVSFVDGFVTDTPRLSSSALISFTMRTWSINRPERSPANPFRNPATDKS